MTLAASSTLPRSRLREFVASVTTIMVKELRSRFRGRRAFIVLSVYLALLALIAYAGYAVLAPQAREQTQFVGTVNASATIGYAIFILLSLFQLLLVCVIAPAFTAGAISLEREKQTLDLLVTTPMRPGAIIVGKLLSALAYVGLVILAAIPLSALVLIYGGAAVDDIVRQQVVLLITAIGFGSIGLFFSSLIKRTQAATVLTYCAMLTLTVGTTLVFIFWSLLIVREGGFNSERAPEQLLWVNPAVAMMDVIANTEADTSYGAFSSVLGQIRPGQDDSRCRGDACFNDRDARIAQPASSSGHFWPLFSLSFGLMSVLLTLASMRFVIPAGMRFVFRRKRSWPEPAANPEETTA